MEWNWSFSIPSNSVALLGGFVYTPANSLCTPVIHGSKSSYKYTSELERPIMPVKHYTCKV